MRGNIDIIILAAGLDSIVRKENVEERVQKCVRVLTNYANRADETLMHLKDRPGSELLLESFQNLNLPKIGFYKSTRKKKRKSWTISFSKPGVTIDFVFKRGKVDQNENLGRMAARRNITKEDMQQALLEGAMFDKHHHEVILGKEARTLDFYKIDHVDVVTPQPFVIFGIELLFGGCLRETVYKT
jgi:hypothetical protein